MTKLALLVDLRIVEGERDAFVARARRHGDACVAHEPGCLRFDILLPHDDANRVFLCEIYADQAAVDAHLATPRMAQYLSDTAPMIVARQRSLCRLAD